MPELTDQHNVNKGASHQCGPGSNPGVKAISGLSLLLVLSLALRGFFPGTPVLLSPLLKTKTSKFQFNLERTETFKRVHKNSKCFTGKQITILIRKYIPKFVHCAHSFKCQCKLLKNLLVLKHLKQIPQKE